MIFQPGFSVSGRPPSGGFPFRQKQHKKPGDLEGSAKQYCAGIEEMARKCLDLILPYLAKRKARLKKLTAQTRMA